MTTRGEVLAYLKHAAEQGAPVFLEPEEVTTVVEMAQEALLAQLGLALAEARTSS